jgi:PPOX class probable F420-dependent enzyme
VIVLVALASLAGVGNAAASERNGTALAHASYIYIATVRKDGAQSKAVPVWFITTPDNQLLIDTDTKSWKARRIRRGSSVLVWVGSRTGPAFIGKAECVKDKAVQEQMIEQVPQKYFLARIGLFGPKRAKFDAGRIVTIRLSLERALPDGFQSQPGAPAPVLKETATSIETQ